MSNENKEQNGTHFLVPQEVLQTVFAYLQKRPFEEVGTLVPLLQSNARSMIVTETPANENQAQEAAPVSENPAVQ